MKLKIERPLVFFDLETTGTDISKDRIVSMAAIKVFPNGEQNETYMLINPGMLIPEQSTEVHGITNEMVKDKPRFQELGNTIFEIFVNSDVAGYNSSFFDVPLLVEEFLRNGLSLPFTKETKFIDSCTIFKKKHGRSLSDALKFYCEKELEDAHNALADTIATKEIFIKQTELYPEIGNNVKEFAEYSTYETKNYDFAGKLVINENGDVCYNIGKAKGVKVTDDPGFGCWMLDKDFPLYTKELLKELLFPKKNNSQKDDFPF